MPILGNFPSGGGSGSGGLTLAAVTNIKTLTTHGKVYVKWTDPEDLILNEVTLASWGGTLLVRKAGSAPVSRRDGTVVLDSKTRNEYKDKYFCDSGLSDGETYYYKFFPYTTQNAYTDSPDDEFNKKVTPVLLGNVTGMSAVAAGNGKLALKWTDPATTVVEDGVTLATWGKTVVTVKEGSYATGPNDDAAAFKQTVTTHNQYTTNALVATGLTNGTTYYVKFFPITTDETVNTATANQITGIPDKLPCVATATPQSLTLTLKENVQKITVERPGDGQITAEIVPQGCATIQTSGNTITVTGQSGGDAKITIHVAEGTDYKAATDITVDVKVKYVTIYGAEWDGTAQTKMTRTDAAVGFQDPTPALNGQGGSSPFDDLMPWSGMTVVDDPQAGKLVKIPKFWYKWTKNGKNLKLQIADAESEGFKPAPAFMDRGDGKGERDEVYVGQYHCVSGYKSGDSSPLVSITRSEARDGIKKLGDGIYQFDYAMRVTIQMLYIVEFADWNSQEKIGYGCGNNSGVQAQSTNAFTYHTGTGVASRTTYGVGVKYRNIVGLWDNVYDWMDGCYYDGSGMNVILNPVKFSDTTEGTNVGSMPSSGYPTAMKRGSGDYDWCLLPDTTSGGSNTTYIPDYWYFSSGYPCLRCGGSYSQGLGYGLFYVSYSGTTDRYGYIGCRLQKLP